MTSWLATITGIVAPWPSLRDVSLGLGLGLAVGYGSSSLPSGGLSESGSAKVDATASRSSDGAVQPRRHYHRLRRLYVELAVGTSTGKQNA